MMIPACRLHGKGLRLLTLACFFHFTGINNGFTYFVVSAGGVERVDLTAACLQKWAAALHPLSLGRTLCDGRWREIFFRSGGMLQNASRRTLRNLLSESVLVQGWARNVCQRLAWASAGGGKPSEWCGRGNRLIAQSREGAGTPTMRTASTHCEQNSWLGTKRLSVWGGGRYGKSDLPITLAGRFRREASAEEEAGSTSMRDKMRLWSAAWGERRHGRQRILFSQEDGEWPARVSKSGEIR